MTASAAPRWTTWRPGPRRFLGLLCVLLFGACAAALVGESSRRRAIATAAGPGLAALPPAVLATAGIVEDSDGAALIVAEGLLDAGTGPGPAGPDGAREIVLETAVRRPGSAHARLLLGRAAAPDATTAFWKTPLELALEAAPGLDPAAAALGRRYLAAWGRLSPEERREGETALTRAFLDPSFLRASFSLALQRLGPETAVRLVPANPPALEDASRIARGVGSLKASELLSERLESEGPAASRPTP